MQNLKNEMKYGHFKKRFAQSQKLQYFDPFRLLYAKHLNSCLSSTGYGHNHVGFNGLASWKGDEYCLDSDGTEEFFPML
jgi:hypothetical protein